MKREILELAKNYIDRGSEQKRHIIKDFYGYGTGLTFMFYGPSGTGKTMLAHALSNELDMDLLTVDFLKASMSRASIDDLIRFVFKEAKLCNGIVFFDECDDVFHKDTEESRVLLIEIEKADCITILASNRVINLDPALDRRITMKVPFCLPDEAQRKIMWQVMMPPNVSFAEDVDLDQLANRYLFTGGLIKNTLFTASINSMLKGDNSGAKLTSGEIERAAGHQEISMLNANGFEEYHKPQFGIEGLPMGYMEKQVLKNLASSFTRYDDNHTGIRLVIGSSEIKTGVDCAEAVAKECGFNIRIFYLYDLLISTFVKRGFKDPYTQEEYDVIEYVFKSSSSHRSFTVLVDNGSFFTKYLLKGLEGTDDRREVIDFYTSLRSYKGILFLVTNPIKEEDLPIGFDYYIGIHLPSEELQIRQWEKHFKDNQEIENKIIELVEDNPMHLNEIDNIANLAHICSSLDGSEGVVNMDHVQKAIKRMRYHWKTSVLFGKKQ